ncbi:MAG: replication-associated protein [Cressdnaviricota sp.]|nr:MAG: replication-associated protein [Cressdnaviricota sp.]
MAAKKANDRKPLEYFPVQRKIPIGNNVGPASQVGLVDGGRILSLQNHRLYRYGKRYEMKIDADVSVLDAGNTITVWALADTWTVQKAYEEAKRVFEDAYTIERENLSKTQQARWFDFRATLGVTGDLMVPVVSSDPVTAGLTYLTNGEFIESVVEDQAGVTRTFSWNPTTTAASYSIPAEYDLASNTNWTPTTLTGAGPYDDLRADASQVEMAALQDSGNLPPYNRTTLPPVWVKIATLQLSSSDGAQRISTGFFPAPCGQVVLQLTGGLTTSNISNLVTCEFKAGDYKGVKAHNMERMS